MWYPSVLDPRPNFVFIILYDFENCLKRSKVINFADDTVVFLPGKTHLEIEQGLNFDLVNISNYFCDNELVINLKPRKTESMLFATGRKLSENKKTLKLEHNLKPLFR